MPLYDYRCTACGDFEAWRSMAEVSTPLNCPDCDEVAKRVITAPNISLNSGSLSSKIGSSEPRLVKRREQAPSQPVSQSQKGGRPWMVGHARERL